MNPFSLVASLAVLIVRPGMLVIATPLLGALHTPVAMRIGLTVLLAIVMAPLVSVPADLTAMGLVLVLAREAAIGLALAFAIRILLFGAELAGHLSGYQLGLSLGALIDPQSGVRNNVLALLYANVTVVVLLATNAHHSLLGALADSYAALPIGIGSVDAALAEHASRMLGLVFVFGVRLAAPVLVVLLLIEIALGLMARVAPALNVMLAGAPIRLIVGLLLVAATVTALPALLARFLPTALELGAGTARAFR